MPGLITSYDTHGRSAPSTKGWSQTAPSIESMQYAVPRQMQTPYGLNEPQWMGYRDEPPPMIYARSPYARVPLPPVYTQTVLNPILIPNGNVSIYWDLTKHYSEARLVTKLHETPSLFQKFQMMPAMSPADTASLTVRLRPFGAPIVLMADCRAPGAVTPITVGDVLRAVYNAARRASSDRSMQSANLDPGLLWSAIDRAGFHDSMGDQSVNRRDALGMNVANDLDFRTLWFGLVPSRTEADVWILQTSERDMR